jgi:hypothetical protein
MGKVAKAVKNIFDPPSTSGAIRSQRRDIAEQERQVAAAAEGQRRARQSNRGLLAFLDDTLSNTFGGG